MIFNRLFVHNSGRFSLKLIVHVGRQYGVGPTLNCRYQSTERVVILGTGWAGFNLARNLNEDINLTVISPSNHFVFTPLLPSTAVGTLEFRCIQEPVRTVLGPKGQYVQAKARSLDTENKVLKCESIHDNKQFDVKYDKLVLSVGVKTNTFGIQSIKEGDGVFFLKNLFHARNIRNNIIDCFEKAAIPGTLSAEKDRILSFVVVGGGPTSCEFVAELYDFVTNDVTRLYKDLLPHVRVTLVEAGPALLGPFDVSLQNYTRGLFEKRNVDVRVKCAVTGIEDFEQEGFRFPARRAVLSDGTKLNFGTMVWSAGLAPVKFTGGLGDDIERMRNGRIIVDDYLRVKGHEGSIWAMGDCAANEVDPLPQLAQVARQHGLYLAKVLNGKFGESEKKFEFQFMGSLAALGDFKGVYDGSHVGKRGEEIDVPKLTGLMALLMWRFAYWGRQTSLANKILIPMHWLKSWLFGRDISRF